MPATMMAFSSRSFLSFLKGDCGNPIFIQGSFCGPYPIKNSFAAFTSPRWLPFAIRVILCDTLIYTKHQIPDPLSDNAGIIIQALQNHTDWDDERKGLLEQLIHMLGRKRYITFVGQPARYDLTQIGQSCLMDVPTNKRGHLSAFRGKRIRLVCVGTGRNSRQIMAGVFQ